MDKVKIAKIVTRFIVGTSVFFAVDKLITQNVDVEKRRQKAELSIGAFVIAAIAEDKSAAWVDQEIDSFVDGWRKSLKKTEVVSSNVSEVLHVDLDFKD